MRGQTLSQRERTYATLRAVTMLLAITALVAPLHAGNNGSGRIPLFSMGAGGRALGMGGANVALANDASAIFWNPATLTALPGRSLSLMYLPLPEGTNYSFAAIGWPTVDYGSFSVAAFLMTTDQIERRDNTGRLLGEFSANEQMYLVGYGKQLGRFLSLGANLKLYGQSFDNTSAYGAGGDLGIKLGLSQNVALGFSAQNLVAPKVRLNRDSESLPVNLKGGAGVTIPFSDGRNHLAVEFDVDKTDKVDPVFHAGAELALLGNYFLRGGYDVDQVNLGAGVHIGFATIGYTFRTQDYFQAQHRVSLDIAFGGSIQSILAKREQDKREAAEQLAKEQRERDLVSARAQARSFFQSEQWDSAEVYYHKVTVLTNGSDQEANQNLAAIDRQRSDHLAATVRAGVLAETDSAKAQELFAELSDALKVKDIESASLSMSRLRPAFGDDLRFKQREENYKKIVSERIAALSSEGTRLSNEGKLVEAALCYDQILRLNNDNSVARRNLKAINDRIGALSLLRSGVAAYNLGDTLTARQSLERLLVASPNDSVAVGLLKTLRSESGVGASSLAEIQKDAATWKIYLDGIEKFRQGDYEQAIKLWQQVLSAYPGNAETEKNIQQAKLRLQQSGKTD